MYAELADKLMSENELSWSLRVKGGGQTNGPGGPDGLKAQDSQGVQHTEWHLGLSQAFEAELLEVLGLS